MKVVKSSVSILDQEPGVIGMYRHIERVGRVAYKSEDRITDDSWEKFNEMLYKKGHHAVFNLGTVYLMVPKQGNEVIIETLKSTAPYTVWEEKNNLVLFTTNYRVICQLGYVNVMKNFWCEPTEDHYHRVTAHWTCSRSIATEILRHRVLCPVMESTRYVLYSKEKFGGELSFILPQWVYRLRDNLSETIDSLTGKTMSYLKELDGQELWNELCCLDRTVASRDISWRAAEEEYMYEVSTDEGERLTAQEARDCLPHGLRCELFTTGYVKDFVYENPNPETNPEKAGFFYLRCASDAHPDIRVLAQDLKSQFIERDIINLK
jgi:hypothetical protein